MRDELGALGIRDNTILWYCSDNGGLDALLRWRRHRGSGSLGLTRRLYEGGTGLPPRWLLEAALLRALRPASVGPV